MAADHLTSQLKELREFLSAGNEEPAKRLIETLNPLSVVDVEKVDFTKLPKDILGNSILIPDIDAGLYIRAGSRRSSPGSLPGFAGYFHCFTSLNMSRRWTHNRLLFAKLRLLKNLKKTLLMM